MNVLFSKIVNLPETRRIRWSSAFRLSFLQDRLKAGLQPFWIRKALPGVFCFLGAFSAVEAGEPTGLTLHMDLAEAWSAPAPDPADAVAVFARVFAGLPDEVRVLPTENYFYWRLTMPGRPLAGNIRPASGRRERGELSFGYSEWVDTPDEPGAAPPVSASRVFTAADGVMISNPGPFTCVTEFRGKRVTFRLHEIEQTPPRGFALAEDEKFLARTWDESGLPFFLMYNTAENYFFWVLNEESPVAEKFTITDGLAAAGQRTGFVFWIDAARGARKVLACVRRLSVRRNDYYDGPFDQLADNYARRINLKKYVEDAFPALRGQVDDYGYYLNRPGRVAIDAYAQRDTAAEAAAFVREAVDSGDARRFIAKSGN